jgi:hypothetical protein
MTGTTDTAFGSVGRNLNRLHAPLVYHTPFWEYRIAGIIGGGLVSPLTC